jgi:16S rRNA (guanine527-N7)-methyltransferase
VQHRDLIPMLTEARRLGFLGPGPIVSHLDHAAGFAEAVEHALNGGEAGERWAADLGSGGGVPGLPLALRFPAWNWALIDSSVRRAGFLRDAVRSLGLEDRVRVVPERAETVGRRPTDRGSFDLIVARSFGPPAVVAECGAPLLRLDGLAVVSEPPGGVPDRWPVAGLAAVGMVPGQPVLARGWAYQLLRQSEPCPQRYPRRVGLPPKRPLF